jgi:hypothetical protein
VQLQNLKQGKEMSKKMQEGEERLKKKNTLLHLGCSITSKDADDK